MRQSAEKLPRKRKTYAELKEAARNEALEWDWLAGRVPMSYSEIADAQVHFRKLSRRYGLLREFEENGIC